MKKFNENLSKTREMLSYFLLAFNENDLEQKVWDVRNTDESFHDLAKFILLQLRNKESLISYMKVKEIMKDLDLFDTWECNY
jgi:hypothetical protein